MCKRITALLSLALVFTACSNQRSYQRKGLESGAKPSGADAVRPSEAQTSTTQSVDGKRSSATTTAGAETTMTVQQEDSAQPSSSSSENKVTSASSEEVASSSQEDSSKTSTASTSQASSKTPTTSLFRYVMSYGTAEGDKVAWGYAYTNPGFPWTADGTGFKLFTTAGQNLAPVSYCQRINRYGVGDYFWSNGTNCEGFVGLGILYLHQSPEQGDGVLSRFYNPANDVHVTELIALDNTTIANHTAFLVSKGWVFEGHQGFAPGL